MGNPGRGGVIYLDLGESENNCGGGLLETEIAMYMGDGVST